MPLKIKDATADHHYTVSMALLEGGKVLNGATKIQEIGSYQAPNPGMELDGNVFTLSDEWFNGKSQDAGTVTTAVEQATGVRLQFIAQMLSSEPATISSFSITDQAKYDATVGKQIETMKQKMGGHGAK